MLLLDLKLSSILLLLFIKSKIIVKMDTCSICLTSKKDNLATIANYFSEIMRLQWVFLVPSMLYYFVKSMYDSVLEWPSNKILLGFVTIVIGLHNMAYGTSVFSLVFHRDDNAGADPAHTWPDNVWCHQFCVNQPCTLLRIH